MKKGIIQRLMKRVRRNVIEFGGWQARDGERPTVNHPEGYEYGGTFHVRVNGKPTGIDFDVFVDDPDAEHPRAELFVGEMTRKYRLFDEDRQPELDEQ